MDTRNINSQVGVECLIFEVEALCYFLQGINSLVFIPKNKDTVDKIYGCFNTVTELFGEFDGTDFEEDKKNAEQPKVMFHCDGDAVALLSENGYLSGVEYKPSV